MSRPRALAAVGLVAAIAACSTTRRSSEPAGLSPAETVAPAPAPAPAPQAPPAPPAPATPETPPTPPTPETPPAPPVPPSPPRSQAKPCMSTRQCGSGQICTVETGDCNRPPGCGPNDICPMVCWGQCATKQGAKAGGKPGSGVTCGNKTCPPGQVCCNPSCSICTPPGGFCTKQLCDPGSTAP